MASFKPVALHAILEALGPGEALMTTQSQTQKICVCRLDMGN